VSGASGTGICLAAVLSRSEPVRWSSRLRRRGHRFRLHAADSAPADAAPAAVETRYPGPRAAEILPVPLRRPF